MGNKGYESTLTLLVSSKDKLNPLNCDQIVSNIISQNTYFQRRVQRRIHTQRHFKSYVCFTYICIVIVTYVHNSTQTGLHSYINPFSSFPDSLTLDIWDRITHYTGINNTLIQIHPLILITDAHGYRIGSGMFADKFFSFSLVQIIFIGLNDH